MTRQAKILIVEADREIRTRLEFAFAYGGNGYQVFTAPSGSSALLQFGIVQPDVILLDVGPGSPDGWDTLRRLRELSTVPVIALSSQDEPAVTIKSLEWGADYCMAIPFSIHELRARVRALLRREARPEGPALQPAWA